MSNDILNRVPHAARESLEDLCQKLAGPDRGEWLIELKRFLKEQNTWIYPQNSDVTWDREFLDLGLYPTLADYIDACNAAPNIVISPQVIAILNLLNPQSHLCASAKRVVLRRLSGSKLGLPRMGADYVDIGEAAGLYGFKRCTIESVLAGVLTISSSRWPSTPTYFWMEPLATATGGAAILGVRTSKGDDGSKILKITCSRPKQVRYQPEYQYVFLAQ